MLKEQRQRHICERIMERGQVTVLGLAEEFGVSDMTIRRDLQDLEDKGLVERIHGGAISPNRPHNFIEPPLLDRMDIRRDDKQRMARSVVNMINPGESIFLGSGTTTYWIAKELSTRRDLTITTNALGVANVLAQSSVKTVIVVGGFLRRGELSMIGHLAERAIEDLRVDKVIIGIRGVHPKYGLTSDYPQELIIDRKIMGITDCVIVVADHTKFNRVATSQTAPVTAAQMIVTTKEAPADAVAEIEAQGVRVIQV